MFLVKKFTDKLVFSKIITNYIKLLLFIHVTAINYYTFNSSIGVLLWSNSEYTTYQSLFL